MLGTIAALLGALSLGLVAYYYHRQKQLEDHAETATSAAADPQAAEAARQRAEAAQRRAEAERLEAEAEAQRQQERRESKLRTVLSSDSRARDYLRRRAGLEDTAERPSEELIARTAAMLPEALIDVCRVASQTSDVELDIPISRQRERVPYPTSDMEPMQMQGFDQLLNMLPEQHALPDEQFYDRLAHQDLLTMQSFEERPVNLLYILLDVSGSMYADLGHGVQRSAWARGIALRLLFQVIEADARYFMRGFAHEPGPLFRATNEDEAAALIERLLDDDLGIDAEIRRRVEGAGGQYDDVDLRATLIWNNKNDLDLHVITPDEQRIYFSNKKSPCGGFLDVDMNVGGGKPGVDPVENIRWLRGQAPAGSYQVLVRNYRFHEPVQEPTPLTVEVEVQGCYRRFDTTISPNLETNKASELAICSIDFRPGQRPEGDDWKAGTDIYAAFTQAVSDIRTQGGTLSRSEILLITDAQDETMDPETVIELMGSDIRLHVVTIGFDSEDLKRAATSYRRLREVTL